MERSGNLPNAQYRRFEGMREYESLIDDMIPRTQSIIRIFDRSLSRRYNTPARIELLRRFLLAARANRLLIALHQTGTLERDCPRLIELLRQFTHSVVIRETLRPAKHVYDPFVVFDTFHYLHRFHYDHLRAAHGTNDLPGAQLLIDRFAEIWEASGPPISATVSGL